MRDPELFRTAVDRLNGDEPRLCLDVAAAGWRLAEEPVDADIDKPNRAERDDALDALLAPASALIALGGDRGLRAVLVAVGQLADPSDNYRMDTAWELETEASLARVVRILSAVALAWCRPGVLIKLERVQHVGEGLLSSGRMRHLRVEQADARVSFDGHVAWWRRCPWAPSVAPLGTHRAMSSALAEVELLSSCVAAASGDTAYCVVKGTHEREPGRRLIARLRDPHQADVFASLFNCEPDEVLKTCGAAYECVEAHHPNGVPIRGRPLVID